MIQLVLSNRVTRSDVQNYQNEVEVEVEDELQGKHSEQKPICHDPPNTSTIQPPTVYNSSCLA